MCAEPDAFGWDELIDQGHAVGNPVEPLVRALRARVGDEHEQFVHFGATSQDILDTAAMLVARECIAHILGDVDRAAERAQRSRGAHRDTPMAGRTLLQQAVPTTFGLMAAGWLVGLLDARRRLRDLAEAGLAVQLGGAAGTLSALGEDGTRVVDELARSTRSAPEPTVPWHTNRVRVAELGAALGTAGRRDCGKIALDVVLLSQTEVGEVRERAGGGLVGDAAEAEPGWCDLARACARARRAGTQQCSRASSCRSTSAPPARGRRNGRRSAARSRSPAEPPRRVGGAGRPRGRRDRMRANLDATRADRRRAGGVRPRRSESAVVRRTRSSRRRRRSRPLPAEALGDELRRDGG